MWGVPWHLAARAAALACCALAAVASSFAVSGKNKSAKQLYAVIAGTVFRDSGLTLRGAEVSVTPEAGSQRAGKSKKRSVVTDARGEFAIRVPAPPGEPPTALRYTVKVEALGFKPQMKDVSVSGDERIDVFFQLEPASR